MHAEGDAKQTNTDAMKMIVLGYGPLHIPSSDCIHNLHGKEGENNEKG